MLGVGYGYNIGCGACVCVRRDFFFNFFCLGWEWRTQSAVSYSVCRSGSELGRIASYWESATLMIAVLRPWGKPLLGFFICLQLSFSPHVARSHAIWHRHDLTSPRWSVVRCRAHINARASPGHSANARYSKKKKGLLNQDTSSACRAGPTDCRTTTTTAITTTTKTKTAIQERHVACRALNPAFLLCRSYIALGMCITSYDATLIKTQLIYIIRVAQNQFPCPQILALIHSFIHLFLHSINAAHRARGSEPGNYRRALHSLPRLPSHLILYVIRKDWDCPRSIDRLIDPSGLVSFRQTSRLSNHATPIVSVSLHFTIHVIPKTSSLQSILELSTGTGTQHQ